MTNTTSILPAAALLLVAASTSLQAQVYSSVTRSTGGSVGDGDSGDLQMSGDGRFVVFASKAANLVSGDSNGFYDVYLRDTVLDTCERISTGLGGVEPDGDCRWPAVSEDGRWVVYGSHASNLVAGDANLAPDVFRYDRTSGTTTRASITYLGLESGSGAYAEHMVDVSDDGRYVAFMSTSTDLVSEFTAGATRDVFVRDMRFGTTTLVSLPEGDSASDGGWHPSISADGSRISFTSNGRFLSVLDSDSNDDVFVWKSGGEIELASVGTTGFSGSSPGNSMQGRITPDGRYVVFESTCADLDAEDGFLNRDIFLRDRTLGTTEVVSYHSDGSVGPYVDCFDADVSADGRYVVWASNAKMTNAPWTGITRFTYLRDRTSAETQLITIPRWWFSHLMNGGEEPHVSDDGGLVLFGAPVGGTPEEGLTIHRQALLRARNGSSDTMSMMGFNALSWGSSLTLTAYDAPAATTVYVVYATSVSGTTFAGHVFDVSPSYTLAGSALSDADGKVVWTSTPLPEAASGITLYLEMAATSGGTWYDSNYIEFDVL